MDDVPWASRRTWQDYRQAIGKECQGLQNAAVMARTFRLPDLGEGLHEAHAGGPFRRCPLTYDHRFVTRGEAARFIKAVVHDLEQPQ